MPGYLSIESFASVGLKSSTFKSAERASLNTFLSSSREEYGFGQSEDTSSVVEKNVLSQRYSHSDCDLRFLRESYSFFSRYFERNDVCQSVEFYFSLRFRCPPALSKSD